MPAGYRAFGWALIALGKEAESVNLLDEVVNARLHSKSKDDHQHPYTTVNAFTTYITVHLGRKNGGFFAAF